MAGKPMSSSAYYEWHAEVITKWLSCNGEAWGVGPTLVFAAAAGLFLQHEVRAALPPPGAPPRASLLENTLILSMVTGMLALLVHAWVCLTRFLQYYLDTLIRDSPNVLVELATAGLLGAGQAELAARGAAPAQLAALGPLTRFLRHQQPQIHITVCWLLALCYADYVRKHCCRFNVPYLEQWQAQLHTQARLRVRSAAASASGCLAALHLRLRTLAPAPPPAASDMLTEGGARPGAAEACDELREYIKATRCACAAHAPAAGGAAASGSPAAPAPAARGASMHLITQQLPAERQRSNTV